MSFHPITLATKTWNEVGPGRYMDSSVTFGAPLNYIQLKPGSFNQKTKTTSAAITRVLQKDVTSGSAVTRNSASASLIYQFGPGFTTAELDALASNISDWITVANLELLLLGNR